MRVITFLSATRCDSTKRSALWGDDLATGASPQLAKLLVIITERESYPGEPPAQIANAYGVDPARTDPAAFVFQAALPFDQIEGLLKCVVSCEQPSAGMLLAWSSATAPLPQNIVSVVVLPNGDPPTTGPKATALLAYADAAVQTETAFSMAFRSRSGGSGGGPPMIGRSGMKAS